MRRAAATFLQFAGLMLIIAVLTAFAVTFVAVAVVVQGSSMEPALHDGERVLVNRLVYKLRHPRRGEIVVFRHGHMPGSMLIKRVIGMPQEELSIVRGLVHVNGAPITEDYTLERSAQDYGPVYVPDGRLFVLGDNRNHSEDSAHASIGTVPLRSIEGKAFAVYWPLASVRMCRDPGYPESAEAAITATTAQISVSGAARVSSAP
jgi:signal peptidase I